MSNVNENVDVESAFPMSSTILVQGLGEVKAMNGVETRHCTGMPHSFQGFSCISRLILRTLQHARVHACGTPRRASRVGSFPTARLVGS